MTSLPRAIGIIGVSLCCAVFSAACSTTTADDAPASAAPAAATNDDAIATLRAAPGYASFTPVERDAWERLIAQPNNLMSKQARVELAKLATKDAASLRALLATPLGFENGQLTGVAAPFAQYLVPLLITKTTDSFKTSQLRRSTMVGAPKPADLTALMQKFQSLKAGDFASANIIEADFVANPSESAELVFRANDDDRTVKLEFPLVNGEVPAMDVVASFPPDSESCGASMWGRSPNDVALAVGNLPRINRRLLTEVDVSGLRNPLDGIFSEVYRPKFRAAMLADQAPLGVIVAFPTKSMSCVDPAHPEIAPTPQKPETAGDMVNTIAHETGHIWSLKTFGRNAESPAWKAWRQAMVYDVLAPSAYAASSFLEDVAESVLIFSAATQQGSAPEQLEIAAEMKALFPHRWAILEQLFRDE